MSYAIGLHEPAAELPPEAEPDADRELARLELTLRDAEHDRDDYRRELSELRHLARELVAGWDERSATGPCVRFMRALTKMRLAVVPTCKERG
jgi:hypothetical protein